MTRLVSRFVALLAIIPLLLTGSALPAAPAEPQGGAPPAPLAKAAPAGSDSMGLPRYLEPPAYSVRLVIESDQAKGMVMHRFVDAGRIRTEITGGPQDLTMIEMGDEKGTSIILSPKEKKAIKQSLELMKELPGGMGKKMAEAKVSRDTVPHAPSMEVEDLGEETRDGKLVKKLQITTPDGTALGWFDKSTGAPVRIETTVDGKPSAIEWKDYKVGPQPAKLFEPPKDYEVLDLAEQMAQMKSMAGAAGMGSALNGMMGKMGEEYGHGMGASLGASLGGAFGGPLGAIAGEYLGGRIGGAIGRKTAQAITPGK